LARISGNSQYWFQSATCAGASVAHQCRRDRCDLGPYALDIGLGNRHEC
jgi:hypothetical protein